MKKNVLLSIASTQQFEGAEPEHIDLMTEAKLYERNGKYYITYEETELTGLEGTRTMVKMDGTTVSMIRTGTYPSELLFAEDQRHVGLYQTDFGALTISTHTSRLNNTIGENGGVLEIAYTIEVDNSMVGHHHFRMTVV
ncbi:MAG: DUF1934 domain-containing protein, partial [Butyricicoccus sp.]